MIVFGGVGLLSYGVLLSITINTAFKSFFIFVNVFFGLWFGFLICIGSFVCWCSRRYQNPDANEMNNSGRNEAQQVSDDIFFINTEVPSAPSYEVVISNGSEVEQPPSYEQVALEDAIAKSRKEIEEPPKYFESQVILDCNKMHQRTGMIKPM